jgi:hypothetical protein
LLEQVRRTKREERGEMAADWKNLARIDKANHTGFCNGGWAYDAYPDLETLDAGRTIVIAEFKGPAVITYIHCTQHGIPDSGGGLGLSGAQKKAIAARGIVFEIYFNGVATPAVRVPLGDFFADGCGGSASHFSSLYVEKAPESYNCFLPMPFEKSARVVLRNETAYDFMNYSYVEFDRLHEWEPDLGYFHATWSRFAFQLCNHTDREFFHVEGTGQLIGRSWSVCTDEPLFDGFTFVMEGNNEFRIDGEDRPRVDYLGSEDSFGFSWGFQKEFCGLHSGMNLVEVDQSAHKNRLSIYRFHGSNRIRFLRSLDLRVDWTNEFPGNDAFHNAIAARCAQNGGWVDYSTTYYWYQDSVGYDHAPMVPLEERCCQYLGPTRAAL